MKTKFNGFLTLLLALVVQISFAQQKTVTGKVSDASGPLPGVTVIVKGTDTGTQTDFDGNYTIKASVNDVISFSYVGFKTYDLTVVSSKTNYDQAAMNLATSGRKILSELLGFADSTLML